MKNLLYIHSQMLIFKSLFIHCIKNIIQSMTEDAFGT